MLKGYRCNETVGHSDRFALDPGFGANPSVGRCRRQIKGQDAPIEMREDTLLEVVLEVMFALPQRQRCNPKTQFCNRNRSQIQSLDILLVEPVKNSWVALRLQGLRD